MNKSKVARKAKAGHKANPARSTTVNKAKAGRKAKPASRRRPASKPKPVSKAKPASRAKPASKDGRAKGAHVPEVSVSDAPREVMAGDQIFLQLSEEFGSFNSALHVEGCLANLAVTGLLAFGAKRKTGSVWPVLIANERPHMMSLATWLGFPSGVPGEMLSFIRLSLESLGATVAAEGGRLAPEDLKVLAVLSDEGLEIPHARDSMLDDEDLRGLDVAKIFRRPFRIVAPRKAAAAKQLASMLLGTINDLGVMIKEGHGPRSRVRLGRLHLTGIARDGDGTLTGRAHADLSARYDVRLSLDTPCMASLLALLPDEVTSRPQSASDGSIRFDLTEPFPFGCTAGLGAVAAEGGQLFVPLILDAVFAADEQASVHPLPAHA